MIKSVICEQCGQDGQYYCGYGIGLDHVLKFCSIKCRREYCDAHGLWMPETDRWGAKLLRHWQLADGGEELTSQSGASDG